MAVRLHASIHRLRLLASVLAVASTAAAQAAEPYPWGQGVALPGFRFGNAIDGHQQTQQSRDGSLSGFLYVAFTPVVTRDGYRVATHVDCNASPGCAVGWRIEGRPATASLLYHPMHEHPVFVVERSDMPQPGAYSHFHWLGGVMPQPYLPIDGYLLQLTAMNRFCFIHHDAGMARADASCRDNGGVPVRPGLDTATHFNVVAAPPTGM